MKWLRVVLVIVIAVSAGGAGAFLSVAKLMAPDQETIKENMSFNETSGSINILFAGLDLERGVARSDTIAVATIDIDSKAIRVMSIPRDSRVLIPNKGWDKINHSFSQGGIRLLREVVINLLGIPINYYVVVNLDSFPTVIDAIGGVTIDVEKKLRYTDKAQNLFIDIPQGVQHLDGKKALQYARFRNDPLGDLGRITRQQKLVQEILRKLKSPETILKLPELIAEIVRMLDTDMSPTQAIQLGAYLRDVNQEKMKFFMMPGKVGYVGALSYWIPDIQTTSMMLADQPLPPQQNIDSTGEISGDVAKLVGMVGKVSILNGDGSQGLVKKASEELQRLGIDVGLTGNAKHFDYRSSSIVVPKNATEIDKDSADALAELCGISKKLISASPSVSSVTVIFGKDKERIFSRLRGLKQ